MSKIEGIQIVDDGPVVSLSEFLSGDYYVSKDRAIREVYGAGGHPSETKIKYRCKMFDNNVPAKQLHQTKLSVKCKSTTVLRKQDKKIISFTPHNRL